MNGPFNTPTARPIQPHPEIDALQEVMRAVAHWLPDILAALPPPHRPLLANALLNLSVNHILEEEGGDVTASILGRLAALIRAGHCLEGSEGFRLNGQDA